MVSLEFYDFTYSKFSGSTSLVVLEESLKSVAQGIPVVACLGNIELQNRERFSQGDSGGDVDGGGDWKETTTVTSHKSVFFQVVDIRFELAVTEDHS